MIVALPLIGASLGLLVLQVWQPWTPPLPARPLARWRVPWRARIALLRRPLYSLAALLVLGGVGGWLPPAGQGAAVAVALAIVAWPRLTYTVTDEGFVLGRTGLQRWSAFAGCTRRPDRLALQPATAARAVALWLPEPPEAGEVAALVCPLVEREASRVRR